MSIVKKQFASRDELFGFLGANQLQGATVNERSFFVTYEDPNFGVEETKVLKEENEKLKTEKAVLTKELEETIALKEELEKSNKVLAMTNGKLKKDSEKTGE